MEHDLERRLKDSPRAYVTGGPDYEHERRDDVIVRDGNPARMDGVLGRTFPFQGLIEMNRPLLEQLGVAYEEVLLHERIHAQNPDLSEEEVRSAVMRTRYTSAPNQQWYDTAHYEPRAPRFDPAILRTQYR